MIGLVLVAMCVSDGLAEVSSTLGDVQKDLAFDDPFYQGMVTGAVTAWSASGIIQCERVSSGAVIGATLRLHPEWSEKWFPLAVADAMESIGCKYHRLESFRLFFLEGETKP
jgi:hypothetical protein